jgi:uncharacterized protein YerC
MVNISKKNIKKQTLSIVSENLIKYIALIKTQKTAENFINELLTPSEQIMIAKRFAAIVMIERGYSYSKIMDTLKISRGTVASISRKRDAGCFKYICESIKKAKNKKKVVRQEKDFWDSLEIIIMAGMPQMGKGRWKRFNEATEVLYQKQRKKRIKRGLV